MGRRLIDAKLVRIFIELLQPNHIAMVNIRSLRVFVHARVRVIVSRRSISARRVIKFSLEARLSGRCCSPDLEANPCFHADITTLDPFHVKSRVYDFASMSNRPQHLHLEFGGSRLLGLPNAQRLQSMKKAGLKQVNDGTKSQPKMVMLSYYQQRLASGEL